MPVAGLCGGYQMLGHSVTDPDRIEGGGEERGLGLLDIRTEMAPDKERRLSSAVAIGSPHQAGSPERALPVEGYEIHHGRTLAGSTARVWMVDGERPLGHASGSVWGCYVHGTFANDVIRREWIEACGGAWGGQAWSGVVDREVDRLADALDAAIDVRHLFDAVVRGGALHA